jgi:hypothetical protein
MSKVLSTAGQVSCSHKGKVTPFVSDAKLTVSGSSIALTSQSATWVVAGCTNTGSPNTPCLKAVGNPASGVATKLTCGGEAVLLDSLSVSTNSNPPALLTATAGQSKLNAS